MRILVLGGGICGLGAALLLARAGPPAHDLARRFGGLMASIAANPDLFRDALEYIGTVTPLQEILERPAVIQRLAAAREALKDTPRPSIPGPTRSQLLQIAS